MRKKRFFSSDDVELTLLSLPTILWYLLFCYIPMFGVIIAFKQYKPMADAGFVSSLLQSKTVLFDNFKYLFQTPDAWLMFKNTILYNVVFILLGMFLTVSLSLMISQLHSSKAQKTCQTAMFLPHFLSYVVVSYFVFSFLSVDHGLINRTIEARGGEAIMWYMEPKYWPYILTFVKMWKGVGYGMVIYLAAISGIDSELYEAAIIDGASKWQQMKYITLPQLKPVILIMFIMSVGGIFASDFGLFYQVPRNSGPLVDVTQTIDVYVYKALMGLNNIGFASAGSVLQSFLGLIMITSANAVIRKIEPENSLF